MKLKYRVIERYREKYPVEAMCRVFEVSRSGYYAWRKRQHQEPKDQWLIELITECQQKCNQTYGCRRVRRWIERNFGRKVNIKAILRVMRKLDLLGQIRRRKKYTQYQQTVHKYPNLLRRAFDQPLPNRFWVTDITYIPTPNGMLYMCAVLDLCGNTAAAVSIVLYRNTLGTVVKGQPSLFAVVYGLAPFLILDLGHLYLCAVRDLVKHA